MNEKAVIVWLIIVTGLLVLSMIVCLGAVAINKKQEQDIKRLHNNLRLLEDYVDEILMDDEHKQKRDMVYTWVMSYCQENQEALTSDYIQNQLMLAIVTYDTMEELYKKQEGGNEEENDS